MNGVVIWHIGRCGSTLLGSTLNQNSEIQWENEIFVPLLWRKRAGEPIPSMPEALAEVAARRTRPLQVVEVKFLVDQHPSIFGISLEEMLETFLSRGFSRFVILKRENHLRRMVSHCVLNETQVGHLSVGGTPALHRITLDMTALKVGEATRSLREWFFIFEQSYRHLAALLSRYPTCEVIYERDLVHGPLPGYGRVCDFLGVAPVAPDVLLTRTNPFRLADILINYTEIVRHLEATEHAWMLSDDDTARPPESHPSSTRAP